MGEYRIGRKHAAHSYPEPRFTGLVGPFARNYATGPTDPFTVATTPGSQVLWSFVAVGAPGTDVPITPVSTGYLRITGMLSIANPGDPAVVRVQVQIGGVSLPIPFESVVTLANDQSVIIPIFAETTPTDTRVGTMKNIEILLTSSLTGPVLFPESSLLDVQEVQVPTG